MLKCNAEADKERREKVEARNQGEALINSTESAVSEHGDKVSADDKKAIEDALASLRETLDDEDADKDSIEEKVQVLATASMKLGEAMYSQDDANAEADAARDAASDAAEEADIVDADYEEVDGDPKN